MWSNGRHSFLFKVNFKEEDELYSPNGTYKMILNQTTGFLQLLKINL